MQIYPADNNFTNKIVLYITQRELNNLIIIDIILLMKPLLLLISIFLTVSLFSQEKGCISGSCENGKGVYIYDNEYRYEGNFIDGKREGPGRLTHPSGDSYDGMWHDDKFHGQGTYIWADGAKYIGEWKQGVQDGYGIYFYTNGDKYTGYFRSNKFHGKGKYTWADGSVQEGIYENGSYIGPE